MADVNQEFISKGEVFSNPINILMGKPTKRHQTNYQRTWFCPNLTNRYFSDTSRFCLKLTDPVLFKNKDVEISPPRRLAMPRLRHTFGVRGQGGSRRHTSTFRAATRLDHFRDFLQEEGRDFIFFCFEQ